MLERLSDFFYDPVVFWTAPLVLVALVAGWRRVRTRRRRVEKKKAKPPSGNGR